MQCLRTMPQAAPTPWPSCVPAWPAAAGPLWIWIRCCSSSGAMAALPAGWLVPVCCALLHCIFAGCLTTQTAAVCCPLQPRRRRAGGGGRRCRLQDQRAALQRRAGAAAGVAPASSPPATLPGGDIRTAWQAAPASPHGAPQRQPASAPPTPLLHCLEPELSVRCCPPCVPQCHLHACAWAMPRRLHSPPAGGDPPCLFPPE